MKSHPFKSLAFCAVAVIMLFSCKKDFNGYYDRPENLEPPIYQQLQTRGNFTSLLACIDKAGYKNILGAAGYWTFFAPHDSAFQVYFRENNISGVEALDSAACRRIVTYSLVYNAFKKERIGDYQANTGWVPNNAFKRRTAYYRGVHEGQNKSGQTIKVIASNRNNNGATYFVDADNNNKYIPYFVNNFMTGKGLTAADYNYFYPNTPLTDFNVVDAVVTVKDIPAENGVIHVINRVITALPGLDEYISSKPEYSEFKRLFDRYLVDYVLNPVVTQKYRAVNGGSEDVYTKVFNAALAFSPNNENFLKLQDNDGQANTYTMFVPTNTALQTYINTVLLEHFTSLDAVPVNIIYDFVNAHMWQTAVWPSKFGSTFNFLGEEARFNATSDVVDKKILSNGIFYGTNKVQEANVFSSVYGKAYLDPNYSMMTSLLNQELKFQISNVSQKYTLFLVSNSVLNAAGYFADPTVDNNPNFQWRYTPPGGGANVTGSSALVRLLRVLNLHVIPQRDITSTTASGVAQSYGGEFITYGNGKVMASGNLENNTPATVLQSKTARNGTVHYIDRILDFTETTIGKHIEKLGTPTASEYNFFWQYLRNANIYTFATGNILNVATGSFYTVFIPNNNAIRAAVNAGLLPGTGTAPNKTPNFNPSSLAEKELVNKFIYYHILNKKSVATDGQESGAFETLLKKNNGDPTTIFVNNSVPNSMTATDMTNRTAQVILPGSNYLSNRTVIHLLDNYLKYID
jgi:uncharacterized surface protein with fasciclin (FAS1) repeats